MTQSFYINILFVLNLQSDFLSYFCNLHTVPQWRKIGLLKTPKREIFDHSDFRDFYAIKSLTVSDFGVRIKISLKNI
jgi:hypothetical protein